ncbi:hypothetical protein [Kitasatospora sp. NPDC088351]|uniref:hypothetical protein n=1 Tax=unclassified Kitasatospora TaxID=2633591 RepID=UPI003423724D
MAAIAGSSQSGVESPEEIGRPPESIGASRPAASPGAVRSACLRAAWAGGLARPDPAVDEPGGSAGPGDSGSVGMLLLPLPWWTAPTVRAGRMAVWWVVLDRTVPTDGGQSR